MSDHVIRKSQWALAHIRVEWRRSVAPLTRKAYRRYGDEGPTDPELCEQLAERLEEFAHCARMAADLARQENAANVEQTA